MGLCADVECGCVADGESILGDGSIDNPFRTAASDLTSPNGPIFRFASETERDSILPNPVEGTFADIANLDVLQRFDGTNWVTYGAPPAQRIQTITYAPSGNVDDSGSGSMHQVVQFGSFNVPTWATIAAIAVTFGTATTIDGTQRPYSMQLALGALTGNVEHVVLPGTFPDRFGLQHVFDVTAISGNQNMALNGAAGAGTGILRFITTSDIKAIAHFA